MKFSATAVSAWMTPRPLMIAANTATEYTKLTTVSSSSRKRRMFIPVKYRGAPSHTGISTPPRINSRQTVITTAGRIAISRPLT